MQPPATLCATQNEELRIECRADGIAVLYQWYHNDRVLDGMTSPVICVSLTACVSIVHNIQ